MNQVPQGRDTVAGRRLVNTGAAVVLALVVASVVGIAFSQRLYEQSRLHAVDSLVSVSALKAAELDRWVEEATTLLAQPPSGIVAATLEHWLQTGHGPGPEADLLQFRLDYLKELSPEYGAVYLFDLEGRPWLTSTGANVHAQLHYPDVLETVLATGRPALVDFHREFTGKEEMAVLEVVVPLLVGQEGGRLRPVGFLLYQIDPRVYLYPMLDKWPTASQSAETVLFRVEGDEVVLLSRPRHTPDAPLSMRWPLATQGLLSAQAARGEGPVLYGVDRRGVPSVGVVSRVPAMGWLLVAKMDEAEIFADARQTAIHVAVATGLVMLSLVALSALILRSRRYGAKAARLTAEVEKLRAAEALQVSEQRLTLALEAANEGLWEWNMVSGQAYLSPGYYAMLGYQPGEFPATFSGWTSLLHPDDLAPLMGELADEVGDEENKPRDEFKLEFRLRTKSGGWRWMLGRGRVVERDGEGLPARIIGINIDVTEQRAQEAERRLLFETIAASRGEIYLFDAATRHFRFVNQGALDNLGFTLEQMRRKTPLDICPYETAESMAAPMAALAKGEKSSVKLEVLQRRADASLYPAEVHLQYFGHGEDAYVLAIVEDLTEREAAEAALRESESRFRTIFDSVHEGILIHDEESGAILSVNRRACEMYGRSEAEMLLASVGELSAGTPPFSEPEAAAMMMRAAAGQPQFFEWFARRKSGELFWVEMNLRLASIGDHERLLAVVRDITARKAQEDELRRNLEQQVQLNKKLEDAQNQLLQSEKMASIGQLAAGVAHELNNPIGFVHSNLGTLEKYLKDIFEIAAAYEAAEKAVASGCGELERVHQLKEEKEYAYLRTDIFQLMAESKDGLARVRKIIQDLKDFSRVGEAEWQWADLHKGIDSTLNIVWNELKYNCKVSKEYGELPEVYCLPSQLNQVFMNLLVNAGHAIENQGEITIATGRNGDEVWVAVTDTGRGIPEENLRRIFEPFFTTKPVGQGTGLGLSLAYSIVQRHQGRIEVGSKVGEGTTFRVVLPIRPAAAPAEKTKS
jgi:PAS domain S-box-containing protein